ncbi:MAG: hypothetical protein KY468_13770 [Armatimonadetes bacterium]|nr:hypothetical protein [Armatimonadota bacterium]
MLNSKLFLPLMAVGVLVSPCRGAERDRPAQAAEAPDIAKRVANLHVQPESLSLDLPREEERYLPVTLNHAPDGPERITVEVSAEWSRNVTPFKESAGEDRLELLPLRNEPLALKAGAPSTLWLRVGSAGKAPGEYTIPLRLRAGGDVQPLPLRLRVWPVTVSMQRPFHVRGYYSFNTLAVGSEVNESTLRQLDLLLGAYAGMGGNVLDWTMPWLEVIPRVKMAGSGENLAEIATATPDRLPLSALPRLDFSHYDPWWAVAKRHGVTHLETYLENPNGERWQWMLDALVGKGRVKAGTPEADRVVTWFYREMRRHFAERGFTGLFCKISDEISPESIPGYIRTAKIARDAGWRPFTTVTGMIPRSGQTIRAMDPWCDQWQLAFTLKDSFLSLLNNKYRVETRTIPLTGRWGKYTNGGAEETWAMKVFGPGSATGIAPGAVESLELREDGKPLDYSGDSPWGNKRRGRIFTAGSLGEHLYVSPFDGSDPAGHRYELRVTVRTESPEGKPLAAIDRTDQVWFYGGPPRPYQVSYDRAWNYPAMALHHRFDGYGQWAFYFWQKTERLVWPDKANRSVTFSPTYCGFRDGWNDARLFADLLRRRGPERLAQVIGKGEGSILQVVTRKEGSDDYTTLANADDPMARNRARRAALQLLTEKQ